MTDTTKSMEQMISDASEHAGNANSREIFSNAVLMSQFLRNYTELTIFANVQPEDFWSLLMKMNIPLEEAQIAVEDMEAGEVGKLFENIEKMDIQDERSKTLAAKKELAVEKDRANAEKNRADVAEEMLKSFLKKFIKIQKENNTSKEDAIHILEKDYELSKEKATKIVEENW